MQAIVAEPEERRARGPLDLGWEFACAITAPVDETERGASQEKVPSPISRPAISK